MKTRLLLLSMICAFAYAANAAPPAVTNIQAGQRTGTKLVDITYTLALDPNESAFVELWFSPDNGLTYPVRCMTVTGDADANVSAGSKTVVWDAEDDWDHQFTSNGRIRVIATYGDQPSGFAGSGSNNGGGQGQADSSLLDIPWNPYFELGGDPANPSWVNRAIPQTEPGPDGILGTPDDTTWSFAQYITGTTLTKILADPIEVTNEKWNEVASWGRDNGYTNLQDAAANNDEPRAGITFWDALRWCNARSEKNGLTPAYYMDTNEALADLNQNGSYETGEYIDLDGNGQYSPGLTTVFRAGANVPNYGTHHSDPIAGIEHTFYPIKKDANGYRLPIVPVFTKLATGGNNQQNWPWGADNPPGLGVPEYADFAQYVRATTGGNSVSSPSPATARQPNGYGIKDVIGNVGEWAEDAWENTADPANPVLNTSVYGGSYLGLGQVNTPSTFTNGNSGAPGWSISKLWDLVVEGNPATTSPAIGLRCVRYEP